MAEGFIGMTVEVKLKYPPNTVLHGRVTNIIAGQTLSLQDVVFPITGERWPQWTVQGTAIVDLQVLDTSSTPTPTPNSTAHLNHPQSFAANHIHPQQPSPVHPANVQQRPSHVYHHAPQELPQGQVTNVPSVAQRQSSNFQDPAILSIGKSPVQARHVTKSELPATPIKSRFAEAAETLPTNISPFVGVPNIVQRPTQYDAEAVTSPQQGPGARAAVSQNTDASEIDGVVVAVKAGVATHQPEEQDGTPEAAQETAAKKKARRGQKKKGVNGSQAPPQTLSTEVSRHGNDMSGSVRSKKGWRQDPLLQPSPQTASPLSAGGKRKSKRERNKQEQELQNGWATEDATDIQDLGEFDFEANHKLFDKRSVFDQLRQDDTTADEDRLVSHNRLHRPGTYGGKNLHPTENVLSPKLGPVAGSNEVGSSSDTDTELDFANGRSSSRPTMSRASVHKKLPSRQSTMVEEKQHPMSASVSSERGFNRSVTSLAGRTKPLQSIATASSRQDRTRSPLSASSSFRKSSSQVRPRTILEPHFAVQHSSTACPVLHPVALTTLEAETISRYSLSGEAITESAARCIAEVAVSMFDPATNSRRGSHAAHKRGSMTASATLSANAVVVVLAGNHVTGARAIAAARQLLSHDIKVIVAEGQKDRKLLHPQMLQQMTTMKKLARSGAGIIRGSWNFALGQVKNLTGPPALIVDALTEGITYDELEDTTLIPEDARDMIDWANRSRAPVLSVGCPGGVSGLDGSSTVMEGEPIAIRPDRILALGAPMQGLLGAMKGGERWDVSVADVGLNVTLKKEEAVPFGRNWVAGLTFVDDGISGEL